MFPAFKDYNLYEVGATDSIRVKWDAVKDSPSSIPVPTGDLGAWNQSINAAIKYTEEPPGVDIWQIPAFTWEHKMGDCEDYAILKYKALQAAGFTVALIVGELKSTKKANPEHAWCAVKLGMAWYALDNMFDHLITTDYYLTVNFIPLAACQGDHVARYGKAFRMADLAARAGVGT